MQKLEQSRRKTQKHAKNIEKQHPNGGSCSKLFSRSFLNHQKRKQRTTSPAKFADKRAKTALPRQSDLKPHKRTSHGENTTERAECAKRTAHSRIRALAWSMARKVKHYQNGHADKFLFFSASLRVHTDTDAPKCICIQI